MFNKMRWRFVFVSLSAFVLVIILLLFVLNTWNYATVVKQLDDSISHISYNSLSINNRPPDMPNKPMDGFSDEFNYMMRYFSVTYDNDGNIISINKDNIFTIDTEEAIEYASSIKSSEKGFYSYYRYNVLTDGDYKVVYFLNAEKELNSMASLMNITFLVAIICILLVFLLLFLFSKKTVAPYVKNIESQRQFITNASHELKTPITAISTSADVLALELPQNEWIENIQSQTVHLSKLISNMITLSRLDEENVSSQKNVLNLSDLAWEMIEPFNARGIAVGKILETDIEDNVYINGNDLYLQQIFSVLLDNALKYSIDKSIITFSLKSLNKKAVIKVSNKCSNSSELDKSKLFQRFYRGEKSHCNKVAGNGIGLSIAKSVAEFHKGNINVDINNDIVTFIVTLPKINK